MAELPNIRHLRAFAALAATGSLTRAAEQVHLSQPAVTQALSKLERIFGGALFERRRSGAELTERGETVLACIKRGLDLIKEAEQKLVKTKRNTQNGDTALARHMTIANLTALSALARAGSFSAAARLLNLSEPAVHRAARHLENITELSLFRARPSGLSLTQNGNMLAIYANLILKEFASAHDEVLALEGRFEGTITIGTLPLVRARVIPRAVVDMTTRYPKVTVSLREGSFDALITALAMGEIDILVGALREDFSHPGLEQRALFHDGLSIVARAGHPLCTKKKITAKHLAAYPWVVQRPNTPTRVYFDRAVAAQKISVDHSGIIETGSVVALRGVLLLSDRLAIISRTQISYEEKAGLLKVLPFQLTGTTRPIGMTTRSGWHPTTLQKHFVQALEQAAQST